MATNLVQNANDDTWLIDIKKNLDDLESPSVGYTICRVPKKLWIGKHDAAYSPQTISIGPLHHGKDDLKVMEELKLHYMLSLFKRTRDETEVLNACGCVISTLDETVRDCYQEKFSDTKSELARMMLLDGCFILELFFRYFKYNNEPDDPIIPHDPILLDDPILHNSRIISAIRRDLALLENQIPFIVLKQLYMVIIYFLDEERSDLINPPSLVDLASRFFKVVNLDDLDGDFLHLLDLIHHQYSPSLQRKGVSSKKSINFFHVLDLKSNWFRSSLRRRHGSFRRKWNLIHSATKLSEAGIEFVGIEHDNGKKENLFDLEFKNGVMKIPQLCFDSSLFQNLIAMEQCLHSHKHNMTSYGLFMDYLVDSSIDVEFLVEKKIIPHNFGDYGQVANIFNNICKQAVVHDFYFAGLCKEVERHCKSKWHVYRKSLLHDYFGNPWMVTSVIAAFVLLVVTVLQTVYTVLSYYYQSRS